MMIVKATHEKHGLIYGTLSVLVLSDDETVFSLLLDDASFSDTKKTSPDKFWVTIEQPTLSDVVTEAARLGLSDIQPLC